MRRDVNLTPRRTACYTWRMNEFLEKVAEVLEVPAVRPEDDFRAVDGWCSLMGFGLLVLLEQNYGKSLTVDDFLKLATVADLARAAGVAPH